MNPAKRIFLFFTAPTANFGFRSTMRYPAKCRPRHVIDRAPVRARNHRFDADSHATSRS